MEHNTVSFKKTHKGTHEQCALARVHYYIPIDSFEIDLGGGRGGGTSGSSSVTDRRGLFGGTSYDCLFGGTSYADIDVDATELAGGAFAERGLTSGGVIPELT